MRISSLQHIRVNDRYFAQPMQSSLPQGARPFENRETEINNGRFSNTMGQQIHSGIDYIVPTVSSSEGVSNHLNTLIIYIHIY